MSIPVPLEGFGGGGAALNFKVLAYATEGELLAAAPAENTIGVITTKPINGYAFSAQEPSPAEGGMVWVTVGTSSPVAFSATKKNPVMVYPLAAKQYVDGAWVDVTCKSYQGGAWVDWFLYLYHDGSFGADHYSSITGTNSAKCSISYNDGYFEVISIGVCYVYEVLGPVQLSSFSSLKMTAQQLTDNYSAKVCIFVGSTAEATYDNNAGFAQLSLSPTEGIRDIVLDVSALSGEYYIFAGAYEVSTQATSRKTRIYEIIAE